MSWLASPEFGWVGQGLFLSLVLGLVGAALAGVLLLTRPRQLFALNQVLSRWIDTADSFREWERPRLWERFYYRHHRLLGTLVVIGAAYVLWQWLFSYRRSSLLNLLGPHWLRNDLDWIVAAGEWTVVLLHGLILLMGLLILFRPSLLKTVERSANRWHTPASMPRLDTRFAPLERGIALYPRLSGLLLLLGSAWCLGDLLPFLLWVLGR